MTGFIKIPDWAARGVLHPREFAVYAALLSRRNHRTGECFPEYATIARESGISRRQVPHALAELEAEGLITVRRTRSVNRYTVHVFHDERPAGYLSRFESGVREATRASNSDTDGVQNTHSGGAGDALRRVQDTHSNQTHKNQTQEPDEVEVRRDATKRPDKGMNDDLSPSLSEVVESDGATEQTPSPVHEVGLRRRVSASSQQITYLSDLNILSGYGVPASELLQEWRASTPAQATELIDEYQREIGRGVGYTGPFEGDPEYTQLSEQGRRFADAYMLPQEVKR